MVFFIVVQCGRCDMFQCIQEPKTRRKFQCKVCTEKNSIRRVYARSHRGKDCRVVCQRLNTKRGQLEEAKDEDDSTEGESLADSDDVGVWSWNGNGNITERNNSTSIGSSSMHENVDWTQFDGPSGHSLSEKMQNNAPHAAEVQTGVDFLQAGSFAVLEAAPAKKRRKYTPPDDSTHFSSL